MIDRVTIKDVANKAGVSVTTVSRIINGHYKKMRPETREKVEQAIKELHFFPTASARRLRTRESHTVGVLVGDIGNVFSTLLAKGIGDVLQPFGYDIVLMNTNNSLLTEKRSLERLYELQVDGIIVQPDSRFYHQFSSVVNRNIPLVIVDREVDDLPVNVSMVTSANRDACYRVGKIIKSRGYDNILAISAHFAQASGQIPRISGLQSAANDFNLSFHNIETRGHDRQWLSAVFPQQLAKLRGRTAVISLMGPVLFDILSICRQRHLSFPRDFGLISFDDWSWSQYVNDGVYLLKQDMELMGNIAAHQLLSQIKSGESSGSTTILPVSVVDHPSL